MAQKYAEMNKNCRVQLIRRPIDSSLLSVSVSGNMVYITGVIKHLRTQPDINLKDEMNSISTAIRQREHISDVVWDVEIRE